MFKPPWRWHWITGLKGKQENCEQIVEKEEEVKDGKSKDRKIEQRSSRKEKLKKKKAVTFGGEEEIEMWQVNRKKTDGRSIWSLQISSKCFWALDTKHLEGDVRYLEEASSVFSLLLYFKHLCEVISNRTIKIGALQLSLSLSLSPNESTKNWSSGRERERLVLKLSVTIRNGLVRSIDTKSTGGLSSQLNLEFLFLYFCTGERTKRRTLEGNKLNLGLCQSDNSTNYSPYGASPGQHCHRQSCDGAQGKEPKRESAKVSLRRSGNLRVTALVRSTFSTWLDR